MFQINAHAISAKGSENFGEAAGAYVTLYIDFIDIDGAYELMKFYITDNGWELKEIEEEYFVINSEEEVEEDQIQYYHEAKKYGYSLIFNWYEIEEEE